MTRMLGFFAATAGVVIHADTAIRITNFIKVIFMVKPQFLLAWMIASGCGFRGAAPAP